MSELTEEKASKILLQGPTRRIVPQKRQPLISSSDDFLPLFKLRGGHPFKDKQPMSIEFLNDALNSDSETSSSGDDASEDSIEEYSRSIRLSLHQLKLKELNDLVANQPQSSQHWLELLKQMLSVISLSSKNARRVRAEVTLSVMERALKAHPANQSSKNLKLAYIKAGGAVWDREKVDAEWKEALKLGDADVWMEWLEWRLQHCKTGVDAIVKDASIILTEVKQQENCEMIALRIFWRLAAALRQAG
jgi:hypothetical protein